MTTTRLAALALAALLLFALTAGCKEKQTASAPDVTIGGNGDDGMVEDSDEAFDDVAMVNYSGNRLRWVLHVGPLEISYWSIARFGEDQDGIT